MRMLQAAVVAVVAVVAFVALPACPVVVPPVNPCTTAIDCDLDQACRGGQCVENVAEGEGEGGEGEGEGDSGGAINAVCQKVSACQGGSGQDVQSCIQQEKQFLDELRASPDASCQAAADDFITLFECAQDATCDQFADQTLLAQLCPIFNQVNNEISTCPISGVGEGEGEGEGEGNVCAFDPFGGGFASSDVVILDAVDGTIDVGTNPNCFTSFSATLTIFFEGDGTQISSGFASFDDFTASGFVQLTVDPNSDVVTAIACGDSDPTGLVAVQLDLVDGNVTNAVCGDVR